MQPCPICTQSPCVCVTPGKVLRCYISVAAVRMYMRIAGIRGGPDSSEFDRAASELQRLAESARLAKDIGSGNNDTQQWRVKAVIRGKKTRLELVVACGERPEGELPQLIAVRNKGA